MRGPWDSVKQNQGVDLGGAGHVEGLVSCFQMGRSGWGERIRIFQRAFGPLEVDADGAGWEAVKPRPLTVHWISTVGPRPRG